MGNYTIAGEEIFSAYDIDGTEIFQDYDIDGDELLGGGPPVFPSSLTLLNSSQISTGQSAQGMATYGGYIFQYFSVSNKMKILNMADFSPVNEISCSGIGHVNTLQFGDVETDTGFPLLYASDNPDSGTQTVYVLKPSLSAISVENTISLPSAVGNAANAVFDFENNLIYTVGYTSNADDSTGECIVCVLDMNNPSTVIDTWRYQYLGVINGLVWNGTHIVLNCNTWSGYDVVFYWIKPSTRVIVHSETFTKEYDSEYQGFSYESTFYLVSKWVYKTVAGSRNLYYEFYNLS